MPLFSPTPTDAGPLVNVLIVNDNGRHHLTEGPTQRETILVDNHSSEVAAGHFPMARIVALDYNAGGAGAACVMTREGIGIRPCG